MSPANLELVASFVQSHPESAARELERQSPEAAAQLIRALPLNMGRLLLSHMLPPYAASLCAEVSQDRAAGLLAEFSANRVAALLRCMPKLKRSEVMAALPEKTAALCRLLMAYSEDTVGAWMTAGIVMLSINCLVEEALQQVSQAHGLVLGGMVPVVEQTQQLAGFVDLRELLRAKAQMPLSQLLHESPDILSSRTSLVSASQSEAWRQHELLPVHNRERQLVGLLRYVDLRRSLEQYARATPALVAGSLVGDLGEAYGGSLVAMLGLLDGSTQAQTEQEWP